MPRNRWFRSGVSCLVAVVFAAGVAGPALGDPSAPPPAPSAFPSTFPPGQNQLPRLPSEPEVYRALPLENPQTDPWYRAPERLDRMRPGQVIRTRKAGTFILGIPLPLDTTQILFRTTDARGLPTVTATTVLIPPIPWLGSPRPIVSYQDAIDATSSYCNPSYTLRAGTFKEINLLTYFLLQGFAIVLTDHDGQRPSLVLDSEGAMVLDGIRAAKQVPALGLRDSAAGLYGYSGGGAASAWAAVRRKSYAPELKILGSAQGGVPGDLTWLASYLGRRQHGMEGLSNFAMWMIFAGVQKDLPSRFDAAKQLTLDGQKLLRDVADRCVYTGVATAMYRPMAEYFAPGRSLFSPELTRLLTEHSLSRPDRIPDIPIFQWHAIWDEILPPRAVEAMVDNYWKQGVDVRFYTMPVPEHIAADIAGWPVATAWLSAVLRGMSPGPRFSAEIPSPVTQGPDRVGGAPSPREPR